MAREYQGGEARSIVSAVTDPATSWWLRTSDGIAKRITPGGLLIGRFPQCDVVTRSPKSSRRQALVYLDAEEGPRVAVMGRGEVVVDGALVDVDATLDDGAKLEVGDVVLEVASEQGEEPTPSKSTVWVLETPDGGLFSFSHSPFTVGSDDGDDLRIETWPAGAVTFRAKDGRLEMQSQVDVRVDGEVIDAGTATRLRRGSRLTIEQTEVRIVTGGDLGKGSTVALEADEEPGARQVRLEFLPRGGRLHIRAGGEEHSVYLTDRRCDFIAVLLQPPPPLEPGDFVPDEQLWNRVWGKQPSGKKTLHVLLHRLRKDLDRVGLDGNELLERAEGGGATRFVLHDRAHVALQ